MTDRRSRKGADGSHMPSRAIPRASMSLQRGPTKDARTFTASSNNHAWTTTPIPAYRQTQKAQPSRPCVTRRPAYEHRVVSRRCLTCRGQPPVVRGRIRSKTLLGVHAVERVVQPVQQVGEGQGLSCWPQAPRPRRWGERIHRDDLISADAERFAEVAGAWTPGQSRDCPIHAGA